MRAKRSKDSRLVDKFSKHRDDLAAESRLHQPISLSTTDEASAHTTGQDEDDLEVIYNKSSHVFKRSACGALRLKI